MNVPEEERDERAGTVLQRLRAVASRLYGWEELRPLLDQEVNRLPDDFRAVVVLCDIQGKTRTEASRELGIPEGTVASRLSRARALLAKRLSRYSAISVAGLAVLVLYFGGAILTGTSRCAGLGECEPFPKAPVILRATAGQASGGGDILNGEVARRRQS